MPRKMKKKRKTLDSFLSNFRGFKETATNRWQGFCPAHPDKFPSLSIKYDEEKGKMLIKCHAGCELEDILDKAGLTMQDLFGINEEIERSSTSAKSTQPCNINEKQSNECTLKAYVKAKKIPASFLRNEAGIRNAKYYGKKALKLPYFDEEKKRKSVRYRTALTGQDRFRWEKGSKTFLYGLWRLKDAEEKGYVLIVEGESDCHTLWYNEFPAIGVPGAANWKEDRDAPYFQSIANVYLVLEPDEGGETLFAKIKGSSLSKKVKVIRFKKFKDVSEAYLSGPKKFERRFRKKLKSAVRLDEFLEEQFREIRKGAWKLCQTIAESEDILKLFAEDLRKCGVMGEEKLSKVIYLCLTTRFLERPVSILTKGTTSSGKSYVTENIVKNFFPSSACYVLTSMSEKALIYTDESFKNRFIWIYEAAGVTSRFSNYIIRTLLSEGRINYEVTEKGEDGGFRTRKIEKEGPTGLILTTTRIWLNPENENRCITLCTDDSKEHTRAILQRIANGNSLEPDLPEWKAFQVWIECSEHRVVIPYARALSELIDPKAVRIRRDFTKILNLIRSHAIVHQVHRKRDSKGRIIAKLKDYRVVRSLVNDFLSYSVELSVPKKVRETVETVEKLLTDRDPSDSDSDEESITVSEIAKKLKVHRTTAYRRASEAENQGYLKNLETKRGQPARYVIGDPLPRDKQILPKAKRVSGYHHKKLKGKS